MNQSQRSRGLDTLRACAILGVFFSHYQGFSFGWLNTTGWIGVDLFFRIERVPDRQPTSLLAWVEVSNSIRQRSMPVAHSGLGPHSGSY